MQVERYELHNIDLLFRRQVESRLVEQAVAFRGPSLFDCKEFGMCIVTTTPLGPSVQWYRKLLDHRAPKPRIAIKVTAVDIVARERKRWHFAMSKLGFLYPVAYEEQRAENGLWVTQYQYRAWHRQRSEFISRAIPDDAICREAERAYKARKRK